jgi:hypothetical protein
MVSSYRTYIKTITFPAYTYMDVFQFQYAAAKRTLWISVLDVWMKSSINLAINSFAFLIAF